MLSGRLLGISVGRRIALLILVQALSIGAGLIYVFQSLSTLSGDLRYSERFTLAPTQALPSALESVVTMESKLQTARDNSSAETTATLIQELEDIDDTLTRYRFEWQASDSTRPDARRYRELLAASDRLGLVEDERNAVDGAREAIGRLRAQLLDGSPDGKEKRARILDDVVVLRQALRLLLWTNIEFVSVGHAILEQHAVRVRRTLLSMGLFALGLTTVFGWRIQRAIGPRIADLIAKIAMFQRTGKFVRSHAVGGDDIATLSNALDAGLSAIHEREREREAFLGVAAHELKTPLTSIVGYAEAALGNPDPVLRTRALEVVRRQGHRIERLIQDVLMAVSARHGQLPFNPKPTNLADLVQRALAELQLDPERFVFHRRSEAFALADEELVTHALSRVLSYASAIAAKGDVLRVDLERVDARVIFAVMIPNKRISVEEIERAFLPFSSVQYEGGAMRHAVGLYLSREIARMHGGTLRAVQDAEDEAVLHLELPA